MLREKPPLVGTRVADDDAALATVMLQTGNELLLYPPVFRQLDGSIVTYPSVYDAELSFATVHASGGLAVRNPHWRVVHLGALLSIYNASFLVALNRSYIHVR